MSDIIQIDGLSKAFRRRVREPGLRGLLQSYRHARWETVEAVHDLHMRMADGETLALIGPNGAGKSTTIKMLTGILYPSSGNATVLGLTPWKQRTTLAMNIATVFGQRSQLWYHLPAGETFDLLSRIYELKPEAYRERRAELVRRFELEPLLGTAVRKLSLGQRMRCEIAAALLHRPRVLFLDEPTIGLDVIAKQSIREIIREMNRAEGVGVLLTSHDAGDIERLCKRVIVINHGRVMFDDRVSTMRRRYLRRKVIDLRLNEEYDPAAPWPEFAGVAIVKAKGFGVKLEVDTDVQPIAAVVATLMASLPIGDITIEDAPLEEIIAAMYRDQALGVGDQVSGTRHGEPSVPIQHPTPNA